jgi:hypothetical protein
VTNWKRKNKTNNLDEIINETIKNIEIETPLLDFHIFGVLFTIWKTAELSLELCETHPYTPDGDIPLIFVRIGFLDINKWLYKKIYDKKYDVNLEI